MNPKAEDKYSALVSFFKKETGWNKARVKFFVSLICALCKTQTVSFVRLSQAIEGPSYQESKLRRLQRFFAQFVIDNDLIAINRMEDKILKISVIVPVYKVEQYLSKCIDSILAQTFTEFEILLIDDGSPDNSGTICDEYTEKDNRIRAFHTDNRGVSSARNLGLENAKGDFICFVDSDDWIDPLMFESLLVRTIDKKADLCVCIESINDGIEPEDKLISRNESVNQLLAFNFPASIYLGLYSKAIIGETRLSEAIHYWEDYEFQLRILLKSNRILIVNKLFYHYFQRSGSANHTDINDKVMSCMLIPKELECFKLNSGLITTRCIDNSYSFFLFQCIMSLLKSESVTSKYFKEITKLSRRYLFKSLLSDYLYLRYKSIIVVCAINSRLAYYLLKNKVKTK